MSSKVALITGVTGQDGAYLAEFLLAKGYVVHGVKRRSSSFNTGRVDHLYADPHENGPQFFLHYGDLTDATNLIRLIQEIQPTEIYNLAAQSHVQVSFETPEYTANADALGTLRLLEAIRILRLEKHDALLPGLDLGALRQGRRKSPQSETTPFYPRSPYAVAKLYAYWITVNYREAYGMHASNGILFNHESPIRGETFVTRKVTRAVAAIHHGLQETLYHRQSRRQARLGPCPRLCRGHVADAAAGAAGRLRARDRRGALGARVRRAGLRRRRPHDRMARRGRRRDRASTRRPAKSLVEIDPRYFRPTEVDLLLGDAVQGAREARLDAHDKLRRSCHGDGRGRPEAAHVREPPL